MKTLIWTIVCAFVLAITGCASFLKQGFEMHKTANVVDYLYPDAKEAPRLQPTVTYLRPPIRVGIAFAPGDGRDSGLSETEKLKLLEKVKTAFSKYSYIDSIEIIPSQYLRAKGGFTNLQQVARLLGVEVVALLSYDQVQFNDANVFSLLYWTIVGAYVIQGDRYDIQTMVDASVFDISSQKLLFRAPGISRVKGSATSVGFSESARAGQVDGYNKAIDQLIPQLQIELNNFKERIKSDTTYQVENKSGYSGGGAFDWTALVFALLLCVAGYAKRCRT